MLWLLLLSGSALKWAGLSPRAQHLFAVVQIFLSSGVVAAGIAAVVFSTAWGSLQCQVKHFCKVGWYTRPGTSLPMYEGEHLAVDCLRDADWACAHLDAVCSDLTAVDDRAAAAAAAARQVQLAGHAPGQRRQHQQQKETRCRGAGVSRGTARMYVFALCCLPCTAA